MCFTGRNRIEGVWCRILIIHGPWKCSPMEIKNTTSAEHVWRRIATWGMNRKPEKPYSADESFNASARAKRILEFRELENLSCKNFHKWIMDAAPKWDSVSGTGRICVIISNTNSPNLKHMRQCVYTVHTLRAREENTPLGHKCQSYKWTFQVPTFLICAYLSSYLS